MALAWTQLIARAAASLAGRGNAKGLTEMSWPAGARSTPMAEASPRRRARLQAKALSELPELRGPLGDQNIPAGGARRLLRAAQLLARAGCQDLESKEREAFETMDRAAALGCVLAWSDNPWAEGARALSSAHLDWTRARGLGVHPRDMANALLGLLDSQNAPMMAPWVQGLAKEQAKAAPQAAPDFDSMCSLAYAAGAVAAWRSCADHPANEGTRRQASISAWAACRAWPWPEQILSMSDLQRVAHAFTRLPFDSSPGVRATHQEWRMEAAEAVAKLAPGHSWTDVAKACAKAQVEGSKDLVDGLFAMEERTLIDLSLPASDCLGAAHGASIPGRPPRL